MHLTRKSRTAVPKKWARYIFNLTTPMGEDGKRITGCKEHLALSRKAACEGMVLLENNGILPLKEGTKISLFGIASLDYIIGGGGSGIVYCDYIPNIYEAFKEKEPKVCVFDEVTKFYYDYGSQLIDSCVDNWTTTQLLPEKELPKELLESAVKNSDVAIITINRYSGEGWDRSSSKGDFYLTDEEKRLVDDVTSAFKHTVIVLDVGGMVDVSWIKENKKIDAALLAWQGGTMACMAVADVICGDANPSGKLCDTFARNFEDYPSADTFNKSNDYVEYFEDIYVGYRYFETIPKAAEKVVYPFGYGLSYTTFDISKPLAKQVGEKIEVDVTVKNTGKLAGKEVIQVYYSAPQGLLGKPKIELGAFAKTKMLNPDEEQTLILSFDINDMASYDDLGKVQKSAYVLEKGEYKIFAGNSCRNLQKADYSYVLENDVITEQLTMLCPPNKLEKRLLSDGSYEALPSFPIKEYSPEGLNNTAKKIESEKPIPFIKVYEGEITLDEFLTQFTDEELILIMGGKDNRGVADTAGMGGIPRLSVPSIMTADGPAGLRINPDRGVTTTAWPCATLLACSFNTELMYEIGRAGGLEAKENGIGIWLTPAMNIHRNPLCGRNFEYFSEDPLLTGKFAAAKVNGMQSVGTAASAKHFACNNKEVNRINSDSRVSERAIREIYLKGFEICVKEAQPHTIMTSYNIINGVRTCESYELLTLILRGEWGFKGMITTDWGGPLDHAKCVLAGNDIRMHVGQYDRLREALNNGEITRAHLEACAKRILEMILKLD